MTVTPVGLRTRAARAGITRDTGLLLAARVMMSAVRASAGVVVPVYLAQLGHRAFWIGTVFLVVGLVSAGLSTTIGLWSDRLGRKPFLVWLPVATGIAAACYAVSANPVVLFVAAAAGSFGRGGGAGSGVVGPYQPAEQALLAGLSPRGARNRLFGVFASGSAAGALAGSGLALLPQVAGSAQLSGPGPYRVMFCIIAALAVAAGVIVLPVAEVAPDPPPAERPRAGLPRLRRRSARSTMVLHRLWMVNSVNGLAAGLFGPFVSFWFHIRFGVGTGEIGAMFAVINAVTMVTNLTADRFSRRFGTVIAIAGARMLQGLLLIPMALMPTFWAAGLVYLVRMIGLRIGMPLRQSYVMGLVPPGERAGVAALSRLPSQLLSATAPTLSGYLLQEVSLVLPFTVAGVFQMINAGLFYGLFRRTPPGD